MKALDKLVSRYGGRIHPGIREVLSSDRALGSVELKWNGNCVPLLPLTECQDGREIGYVSWLLERANVAALMRARVHNQHCRRRCPRGLKAALKQDNLAKRMRQIMGCLAKGPLKVVSVQSFKHQLGGHHLSLIGVIFEDKSDGRLFGYFFHLKSGLMLTGQIKIPDNSSVGNIFDF